MVGFIVSKSIPTTVGERKPVVLSKDEQDKIYDDIKKELDKLPQGGKKNDGKKEEKK